MDPRTILLEKKEQGRQIENLSCCLEEDGGEKEEAMVFNLESDTWQTSSHRMGKESLEKDLGIPKHWGALKC